MLLCWPVIILIIYSGGPEKWSYGLAVQAGAIAPVFGVDPTLFSNRVRHKTPDHFSMIGGFDYLHGGAEEN